MNIFYQHLVLEYPKVSHNIRNKYATNYHSTESFLGIQTHYIEKIVVVAPMVVEPSLSKKWIAAVTDGSWAFTS